MDICTMSHQHLKHVMATGYHEAAAPFPGYAGIVKLLKPLVL
jgi:hypothetical protein